MNFIYRFKFSQISVYIHWYISIKIENLLDIRSGPILCGMSLVTKV